MRVLHRQHHRILRRTGATLTLTGLLMVAVLALGQFGILAAGATEERSRDGSFESDTTVISDDRDAGGGGGGGGGDTGGGDAVVPQVDSRDGAGSRQGPRNHTPSNNVTICHATSSAANNFANAYNVISPDVNSVGGNNAVFGQNGHAGHGGSGALDPNVHSQANNTWGDIIPPFQWIDHQTGQVNNYNGLNWDAQGQAIWNNNCALPPAPPALSTPQKGGPVSVAVGSTNNAYTVSVTNTGGSAASAVTITDNVPAGLTVTSVTWQKSNPGANGTCTAQSNVSCSVGTLAAGQSVVVTITFSVTAGACPGPILNTASVSASGIASQGSNQTSTTVTNCPAAAAPDIAVIKSGPASATENTPYAYSITVSNLGNADALPNIVWTDALPAGVVFVSLSAPAGWNCTTPVVGNNGTVTCTRTTAMAQNESDAFTLTVRPDGSNCLRVSNTATVTSGSANDSNPNNQSSSAATSIDCNASVSITKTGGPTGNVAQTPGGVQLTYTVTVTNTGNGAAPLTVITDDLNDQLTNVSAVVVGNPPGNPSCSVGGGNVVTCGNFTLASGNSPNNAASVSISALVPAGVCPVVNNSASATTHTGTPNQSSIGPSNTLTTTVTGCGGGGGVPALSIDKTANPTQANAGDPVSFTITVQNVGAVDAHGVTISDALPGGLAWTDSSAQCSIGAGNQLSCNVGTLAPTASLSVTVNATSDASFCGALVNTASASAQNAPTVADGASVTLTCQPGTAGLVVVKTASPSVALVGDTIVYTFTVTLAAGSSPVSSVTVTDPVCDFPPGISGPTGDTNGNDVLETGETWAYSCEHTVTASDPDPLPNTVTICATAPAGQVCASDDETVDVAHPRIVLDKGADPGSGTTGSVITYTYDVRNPGDVTLFSVTVDDDVMGHICTIGTLAVGASARCEGTYVIPARAPAELTNVAVAEGLYATSGTSSAVWSDQRAPRIPLPDPRPNSVRDFDDATITVVGGVVVGPTITPPGGLAFTGPIAALPLAGLALLLLTTGSGLMWVGRRRGSHVAPGYAED